MTLRWLGLLKDPITGPRFMGSIAPHCRRIGFFPEAPGLRCQYNMFMFCHNFEIV